MASPLINEAEKADEIGSVFSLFRNALPDRAPEVTGLMSQLFAISSTLRKIQKAVTIPECRRKYPQISSDIQFVQSSLSRSLKTILQTLGDIGDGKSRLTRDAYQRTWHQIHADFKRGGQTLLMRLEAYRTFFLETDVFIRSPVGITSPGKENIRRLQYTIRTMDDVEALTDGVQGLGLQPSGLYHQ